MADEQKQPQKTAVKTIIKKKKWYDIIAPNYFGDEVIGECYLEDIAQGVGRKFVTSMMTITGEPQKQNVSLSFEIKKTENSKLLAELIGYQIIPAAVRKMMRRGKSKVEDSFVLKTSDGVLVRIKPIFITRSRAKGSVVAALKKKEREYFAKNVPKLAFENLLKEVLTQKFQSALSSVMRKVYPLGICEIRMMCIEPIKTAKKTKILEVPPETAAVKTEETQQPAEA